MRQNTVEEHPVAYCIAVRWTINPGEEQRVRELALLNYRRARYLREQLAARGVRLAFASPVFNEFVALVPDAAASFERARKQGIVAGLRLAADYPELKDGLLLCVTELHSPAQIDRLVAALCPAQAA